MVRSEAMFPHILRRMAQHWRAIKGLEERGLDVDFDRGQYVALKNVFRDMTQMDWDSIDSLMLVVADRIAND
jgi:hypothetical protein